MSDCDCVEERGQSSTHTSRHGALHWLQQSRSMDREAHSGRGPCQPNPSLRHLSGKAETGKEESRINVGIQRRVARTARYWGFVCSA